MSKDKGVLVVLSGPSGVGKDTVIKQLFSIDSQLRYSISYTTRAPRADEIDDESYSFVDDDTFHAMASHGEFLESANVHGYLYGTSRARVEEALQSGHHVVVKIDVQGAQQLRSTVDDALFIFLLPPSAEELERRLRDRDTEDGAVLERRLADAKKELAEASRYDFRVVNDNVERAATEIRDLIASYQKEHTHA